MPIILFGFRRKSATLAMLTLACRNGHVAAHRLVKVTRWFTLFFIPIVPFNRKYYSVCAQCGVQVGWTKEDAERAATTGSVASPSAPVDPIAPPLTNGAASAAEYDAGQG
jgi:zinc-ribbon family